MKISTQILDKVSIFYIVFPLIIFLIGWLNVPTLIISLISLTIVIKYIFKNIKKNDLKIDNKLLIFAIILCTIWCSLSGIGGFTYQSSDWHMRNALFRDLINFSYPVIYDNGSALVYYISTFLPGALIGKLCMFLGKNEETSFTISNYFNYLYCTFGLILISLQIFIYVKAKKLSNLWILFLFILFSGIDILILQKDFAFMHIERHFKLQYSSNTTLLFWVYNQTIIPWLITTLFVRNYKRVENYGFYGVLLFFTAPLPFIGLSIYFIIISLINLINRLKTKYLKPFLKRIFSIQNILSVLILFPIIYFYFSSNGTANSDKIHFVFNKPIILYFSFLLFEFGAYILLIKDAYKKSILYYITLITLLTLPFLEIGTQTDLCMRTSICGLFILMLLIIKFLANEKIKLNNKIIIIICLCLGAITPYYEIYRGIYLSKKYPDYKIKDEIYTLNNKINNKNKFGLLTRLNIDASYGNYKNYGTNNPNEQIFFKYLAKRK